MILTLLISCFLGLGALQPSCAAPRSNENNVVEVKDYRNAVSYDNSFYYSLVSLTLDSSQVYNMFKYTLGVDSSYNFSLLPKDTNLPWSYPYDEISPFITGLTTFNWGSITTSQDGRNSYYNNPYWYQWDGTLPILYNGNLNYSSNGVVIPDFSGVDADFPNIKYFIAPIQRLVVRIYRYDLMYGSTNYINNIDQQFCLPAPTFAIRFWYMFDSSNDRPSSNDLSNVAYTQYFMVQLPTPNSNDFVVYDYTSISQVTTSDYKSIYVNTDRLWNHRYTKTPPYTDEFQFLTDAGTISQGNAGSYDWSPTNFRLYSRNAIEYGSLADEGIFHTSEKLDNLMFGLQTDFKYQLGYNYGYDAGVVVDNGSGYQSGFDAGNQAGYQTGYQTGYDVGLSENQTGIYNNGYDAGYDSGYDIGYQQSIDDNRSTFWNGGFDAGYASGLNATISPGSEGYQHIYNEGKQAGYSEGLSDAQSQSTTASQIFAGCVEVGLLPVNVFLKMFEYEVFGINIAGFVSALMTIAIVVIIIRMVTGKKNDK